MEEQNTTITKPLGILKSTILCLKMMVMPKHIIESEEFTRIDGRARYFPAVLSTILAIIHYSQMIPFSRKSIAVLILLALEPFIYIIRKYLIKWVLALELKQADEINRSFSFIKLFFNVISYLEAIMIVALYTPYSLRRPYIPLMLFFIISLIPYFYFAKIVKFRKVGTTKRAVAASIPLYFVLNLFRVMLLINIVIMLIGFVPIPT